jgi:5-methylthioadenosine/S-adenosylhomocysteine deaminase
LAARRFRDTLASCKPQICASTPAGSCPIEPQGALRDHALIVTAGRVAAILPFDEADRAFDARERLVLRDHVLMPGLVNAHTHAAMSLFRGLADDVPA